MVRNFRVKTLFEGLHVINEEYYMPSSIYFGKVFKWVPAALQQIITIDDVMKKFGHQCNACFVVSPTPKPTFLQEK